jgi:hypothetical protein
MKIEIYNGDWKVDYINNNPNKIFVFCDNNARIGKVGQSIIRDLSNSMGIRTKKGPSNKSVSFYKDSEYEKNCKNILEDILDIKEESLKGSTIVFSDVGYGGLLSSLNKKAPKTFKYLCQSLKDHFNFDNEKGKKWNKIPGHDEITRGVYVSLDNTNKDILQPVNNSYFKPEFLEKGLNTTFDLIKTENKVSFTSSKEYKNDDVIIFTFSGKEHIVCRVICSYSMELTLKDYKWYSFEGFDNSFSIAGPDPVLNSKQDGYKYQTHFQFICTLNDKGNMVFKNDIFSNEIKREIKDNKELKNEENVKVVHIKKENEKMSVSNEEIFKVLKSIESKLEKRKFKNIFKKKTLDELVQELGDVLKIDKIESGLSSNKYQIEIRDIIEPIVDGGSIFYVVDFNEGFFRNKIDVIMKLNTSVIS